VGTSRRASCSLTTPRRSWGCRAQVAKRDLTLLAQIEQDVLDEDRPSAIVRSARHRNDHGTRARPPRSRPKRAGAGGRKVPRPHRRRGTLRPRSTPGGARCWHHRAPQAWPKCVPRGPPFCPCRSHVQASLTLRAGGATPGGLSPRTGSPPAHRPGEPPFCAVLRWTSAAARAKLAKDTQ
jgi:hypothetical protein